MIKEFLKDIRNIVTYVATHDENGFDGYLKFHGNVQELMSRYPQATEDDLRRGSLIVMKELSKIERDKWYAERVFPPSSIGRGLHLISWVV